MAKNASTAVLDGMLDVIAAGTELYLCAGQPTSRADAITRSAAPAITLASGDFSKANSGLNRVLTVASKSVTANSVKTVDHLAICTASNLLFVTTCPAQETNDGGVINVPSFTQQSDQPI